MLLSIQYPLADVRPFLPDEGGRLGLPTWPSGQVDSEFVRSFGGVKRRLRGGLAGWVGEGAHCYASRSVRFKAGEPRPISLRELGFDQDGQVPLRSAFRRLYADGLALVKAELGFALPERLATEFPREGVRNLIQRLLEMDVNIFGAKHPRTTSVARAGKPLAEAYCQASTSFQRNIPKECEPWWVTAGRPIIFWESGPVERTQIPYWSLSAPVSDLGLSLWQAHVTTADGVSIPIWFLFVDSESSRSAAYQNARSLRICLLRLHAECECLRIILRHLSTGHLRVEQRSSSSDVLQLYLRDATRRISGLAKEANEISETDLAIVARSAIQTINPGDQADILAALRNLDIRKNIFHKVNEFVSKQIVVQNLTMEQYNISGGQQGAVGHAASAQNNVFNQLAQTIDDKSLSDLAEELKKLRNAMKPRAGEADQDVAVGAITEAEAAARSGNKSKVVELLAKAGKWTLGIAKEIGVPIATKLLESAVGLTP